MSNALPTIANHLFGWITLTLVLSWLLAALYPLHHRLTSKANAHHAAFFTLSYALMPALASTIALIVLALPKLAFPLISSHCHGAVCAPHSLQMTNSTLQGTSLVGIALTALTIMLVLMARQLVNSRRQLRALGSLSESGPESCRIVESRDHIAWCAGLLKPEVYLSTGLIERLTPQQLRFVVAHEQMHGLRRDNLRNWGLYWATLIWPKSRRRHIRQALKNYHERACDLAATQVAFDKQYAGSQQQAGSFRDNLLALYSAIHREPSPAHDHQNHLRALEQELARQGGRTDNTSAGLILSSAGIWLATITAAVHFGHPVLELLAR